MEGNSSFEAGEGSSSSRELSFDFKGVGLEYFKIWIVNVLLTILTLGIYSAWAKVRSHRYFYSNLYLDGSNFRYLAEPLTILKGRIIAVAALIAYSVISSASPTAGVVLAVILVLAIPYFVNQALAFNHRMSAYKNIQFRFKSSYGEAFMVLYIWPLLGVLTLGILYPMAILKLSQYTVRNSAYGTTNFDFKATYRDYGIIFLICLAWILGLVVIAGIISFLAPQLESFVVIPGMLIYFGLFIYFTVASVNLFYRSTVLDTHEFKADLTLGAYARVLLTNMFLIIITLGLYFPAAKVRMTNYIASCVTMRAKGSLDNFAAAEKENISALGEEFGQVFDFGI
ncbi:MAG: DUF898 domain-containing protein [Porticoccaceae bacterium]|nr:DUF898 domain-containing protein [Porticoccaceae bacterium]